MVRFSPKWKRNPWSLAELLDVPEVGPAGDASGQRGRRNRERPRHHHVRPQALDDGAQTDHGDGIDGQRPGPPGDGRPHIDPPPLADKADGDAGVAQEGDQGPVLRQDDSDLGIRTVVQAARQLEQIPLCTGQPGRVADQQDLHVPAASSAHS
jgi:hypothetical protein